MFEGEIKMMKNFLKTFNRNENFFKVCLVEQGGKKINDKTYVFSLLTYQKIFSKNRKKIERKKYVLKIHFQVSYVLAFYFFLSFFLLCYRRVDSSFFHFSLIFFFLVIDVMVFIFYFFFSFFLLCY